MRGHLDDLQIPASKLRIYASISLLLFHTVLIYLIANLPWLQLYISYKQQVFSFSFFQQDLPLSIFSFIEEGYYLDLGLTDYTVILPSQYNQIQRINLLNLILIGLTILCMLLITLSLLMKRNLDRILFVCKSILFLGSVMLNVMMYTFVSFNYGYYSPIMDGFRSYSYSYTTYWQTIVILQSIDMLVLFGLIFLNFYQKLPVLRSTYPLDQSQISFG